MLHRLIIAAALASSGTAALASPTYIHAGRVIAVPGKAPLGPSTIIVDNGRIVEVRAGLIPAPAGAATIELGDKTVLPGLIEATSIWSAIGAASRRFSRRCATTCRCMLSRRR